MAFTDPPAPEPVEYTVVAGDTLTRIAVAQGRPAGSWQSIYDDNKARPHINGQPFTDPDVIYPGDRLTISAHAGAHQDEAAPVPRARSGRHAASVDGARRYARATVGGVQFTCLDRLVRAESGWNHRAVNPASGAYGLPQSLPATKMASAGHDWRTNAMTQMTWMLGYVRDRYGTPCRAWAFWQNNKWY